MPCVPFNYQSMRGYACVRVRGLAPTHRCAYCGQSATVLCDWPKGQGTCDRRMCNGCAIEVDKDLHQCHAHSVPGLF